MIRLVVNADDLGLHPAIDEGILRAHRDGIVTSATVLVTGRTAPKAIAQANAQGLALGVHLCLSTRLPPVEHVPTLCPDGFFRTSWASVVKALLQGKIAWEEIRRELRAQIALARSLGMNPDHLDSHQHLHLFPLLSGMVQELAREEGLPLRWPSEVPQADWIRRPGPALKSAALGVLARLTPSRGEHRIQAQGIFEAGTLDEGRLAKLLRALTPGTHEIGCHPGAETVQVPEDPQWRYGWTKELAALCSPSIKAILAERNIALTTYAGLTYSGGLRASTRTWGVL